MAAKRASKSGRYERPGLRRYWSVHFEAWQWSGLSKRAYCREHRLNRRTFDRWLAAIGDKQALSHKAPRKIRHPPKRPCSEAHEKAVRAFWAMHVEAQRWCGLTAETHARAHHLSAPMLRRWRDRLDAEPREIDWRALVHPSARPHETEGLSPSAKDGPDTDGALTVARRAHRALAEGPSRRSFTEAQKLAIVMEAEAPDVSVNQVAKRHGLVASMVFRWRAELGLGAPKPARFARVRLTKDAVLAQGLPTLLPIPDGAVAVDLPGGRRVFAPPGSNPEAFRRFVAEREAGR